LGRLEPPSWQREIAGAPQRQRASCPSQSAMSAVQGIDVMQGIDAALKKRGYPSIDDLRQAGIGH
jgi:hypothetical protein